MSPRLSRIEPLEPRALMAAGDFDTAFGNAGGFSDFTPTLDNALVARTLDGKLVVAGSLHGAILPGGGDALFSRYLDNGTLDTSFGKAGFARVDVFAQDDQVLALAAATGGKVVALLTGGEYDQRYISLVRLNADGTLDTTFAGDGKLRLDQRARQMLLQTDGKIVFVVSDDEGTLTAARFTTAGVLDKTFGTDGVAPIGVFDDQISGVVQTGDGKLVFCLTNPTGIRLLRLDANGRRADAGAFGSAAYSAPSDRVLYEVSIAAAPGNRLAMMFGTYQSSSGGTPTKFIYRYDSLGRLDTSLDHDGKLALPTGDYFISTAPLRVRTDGKLVVLAKGGVYTTNIDGTPDQTFGVNGRSLLFEAAYANDAVVQVNNRVVLLNDELDRLNTAGMADRTFSGDGKMPLALPPFRTSILAGSTTLLKTGQFLIAAVAKIDGVDRFVLQRRNRDYAIDKTFAANGRLIVTGINPPTNASSAFSLPRVIEAPDGKLYLIFANTTYRLTAAGKRDTTFASGTGKLAAVLKTVAADGKLLVSAAGTLRRYTAAGLIDKTFAAAGSFALRPVGSETFSAASVVDVKIGPGGAIFADFSLADYVDPDGYRPAVTGRLVRLNSAGVIDKSYGDAGSVLFSFGSGDTGQGIGSFVVLDDGVVFISSQEFENSGIDRVSANGKTTTRVADGYVGFAPLVRDSKNRVYAIDEHYAGQNPIQTHRYLPTGEDDPTFAGTTIEVGTDQHFDEVPLIAPDGGFFVAGNTAIYDSEIDEVRSRSGYIVKLKTESAPTIDQSQNGTLRITTAAGNDRVAVSRSGTKLNVSINGSTHSYDFDAVPFISASLGGGSDRFTTDATLTTPIYVNGGAGNDTITTGAGNDYLTGGAGSDQLFGGGGSDAFFAGDRTRDTLDGGSGDGQIYGFACDSIDILRSIENPPDVFFDS